MTRPDLAEYGFAETLAADPVQAAMEALRVVLQAEAERQGNTLTTLAVAVITTGDHDHAGDDASQLAEAAVWGDDDDASIEFLCGAITEGGDFATALQDAGRKPRNIQ
jgi:hypothetical protein